MGLFGDRFYFEKTLFSILKWKEKGHLYGERNGTIVSKQALSMIILDFHDETTTTIWNRVMKLTNITTFMLSGILPAIQLNKPEFNGPDCHHINW